MTTPATTATPWPLDDDALAAQLRFVRRLARALVRDDAAADDLAQETLVTALRSPPREGIAWHSWLAGVARRLAWRARRGEERRARHERTGGAPSAGREEPAAAETAARLELSRRVIAEVQRLGEPYATTLRRRFLDGLDADAIARLEGVPVETVRTRVKRGLAQLRERLDAAHGGKREEWAGVLGPWIGGGVMAVKSKGLLVAAAALVLAAGGIGWRLLQEPRAELDGAGLQGEVARAAEGATTSESEGTPRSGSTGELPVATRESTSSHAVSTAADPIGIVLQGRVHHPDGVPFESLEVWLDSVRPEIAATIANGDATGAFAFSGLAPGRWRLRVREVEGCEPLVLWVDVAPSPAVQCVDLALRGSVLLPIRLVTSDGRRLFEALDESDRRSTSRGLAVRASSAPPARELTPNPSSSSRPHDGRGFWVPDETLDLGRAPRRLRVPAGCDGLFAVGALPCHVGVYFKHLLLHSVAVDSADAIVSLTVDPEEIEELHSTVTARLVDAESGAPVAGGYCTLSDRQTGKRGQAADRDGVVRFEHVTPGLMHLHRMPDRHASLSRFIRIDGGGEIDLGEIRLALASAISGRVVDEAGRPVERATIEWYLLDALSPDQPIETMEAQPSGPDGRFTSSPAKARLLVLGQERVESVRRVIEPRVIDATSGTVEPLTLIARDATPLRIELGDTLGEQVTVRTERSDGLPVDWAQVEGPVDWSQPLPPGNWRFVVDHAHRGRKVVDVVVGREPLVVPIEFGEATRGVSHEVVAAHPCTDVAHSAATVAKPATSPAATSLLLFGSIVDDAGLPVKVASIRAVDGDGERHAGSSGAAGSYAIAGLPAGECDLSIEAKGFVAWRESLELAAEGAHVRHDLVLQRKVELLVRFVAPDGRPLHEAVKVQGGIHRISVAPLTLIVTRQPLAVPLLTGRRFDRASEAGRFQRTNNRIISRSRSFDGTLEIEGAPPFFVTAALDRKVLRTIELSTLPDELVVTIEPAEIDGAAASVTWRAVDALADSPVALSHVSLGSWAGESSTNGSEFLQADGSYRASGLDPGVFTLGMGSEGHPAMEVRLLLAPGEQRDLSTIRLPPETRVLGRFVDEHGHPAKAYYRVRTAAPLPGIGVAGAYDGSEAKDGAFEITAGRVPLRITVKDDAWAWQSTLVDPSNGPVEGLVIPVAVGTRVRLAVDAERWRTFQATVLDEDGNALGEAWLESGAPKRFALRPGRYRIALAEDGVDRGTHELLVGSEPVALTIPVR